MVNVVICEFSVSRPTLSLRSRAKRYRLLHSARCVLKHQLPNCHLGRGSLDLGFRLALPPLAARGPGDDEPLGPGHCGRIVTLRMGPASRRAGCKILKRGLFHVLQSGVPHQPSKPVTRGAARSARGRALAVGGRARVPSSSPKPAVNKTMRPAPSRRLTLWHRAVLCVRRIIPMVAAERQQDARCCRSDIP
jgi:hypothetical protein